MKKSSFFSDFLKPILVLVLICAVVGAALAYINSVTEPVIAENDRIQAETDRKTVLEEAVTFEAVPVNEYQSLLDEGSGITGIFRGLAESGEFVGIVVTAENRGYGGLVPVTVGIGRDGSVLKAIANVSTETEGLGSKAGKPDFLGKFEGAGSKDEALTVDAVSGATRTSTAVKKGIGQALDAFEVLFGMGGSEK